MDILVLNTKFESVAILDRFESLIWTDRFMECGDFEIYTAMDSKLLQYMKQDYYLYSADSEHMMIIEQLRVETDSEDGNHLKILGRSLESILDRRVIWGQKILTGNLQDAIQTLLNENVISPTIADRKISNFIFKKSTDPKITALTIDAQYTGDNLYTVINKLCDANNIGFKVTLNNTNQFVFELYVGADRSYDQDLNPHVVFSPKFDNIITSSYLESKKTMKNVTLVAGEGEGADRKTTTVGTATGLDRRELFTDARDISSSLENDKKLTDAEYTAQLVQRGKEDLAKNVEIKAFEGEVDATHMFVYGEDFFIGDIVQIANEYGHEGTSYISELVISQNKEGIKIYPTFKSTVKEDTT